MRRAIFALVVVAGLAWWAHAARPREDWTSEPIGDAGVWR